MAEGKGKGALEKLTFTLALLDELSGPLGDITKRLDKFAGGAIGKFTKTTQAGIKAITFGWIGAKGAVEGFISAIDPALEVSEALGHVRGSTEDLEAAAMRLNGEFGGGLTNIIGMLDELRAKTGLTTEETERLGAGALKIAEVGHADKGTVTDFVKNLAMGGTSVQDALNAAAKLFLNGGVNDPRLRAAPTAASQYQAFIGQIQNLSVAFSQKLLPVIVPFLNVLSMGAEKLRDWMERFPHLTQLIALLTVALGAAVLVSSVLLIIGGALSIAFSPVTLITLAIVGLGLAIAWLVSKWDELSTGAKFAIAVMLPFVFFPALIIKNWEPIKAFFMALWEILQRIGQFFGAGAAGNMGAELDLSNAGPGVGLGFPPGEVVPGGAQAISNVANSSDNRRSTTQINNIRTDRVDNDLLARQFNFAAMQ